MFIGLALFCYEAFAGNKQSIVNLNCIEIIIKTIVY